MNASRLTVLIIDDDARNCELLGRLLEMEGCRVIRALNLGEGLQRAAAERLDLVLLDVRMPVVDGFTACTRLRADPVLGSLPIYLVTAFDDSDVWPHAQACGATGLLGKPYDRGALRHLVSELRTSREAASRDTPPEA